MRVYYYLPKGISGLDGKRIYGYALGYEPLTITWDQYCRNKASLIQAPFTKEYLEKRFEREGAPNITFTLQEINHLSKSALNALCKYLYVDGETHKQIVTRLQVALRNV